MKRQPTVIINKELPLYHSVKVSKNALSGMKSSVGGFDSHALPPFDFSKLLLIDRYTGLFHQAPGRVSYNKNQIEYAFFFQRSDLNQKCADQPITIDSIWSMLTQINSWGSFISFLNHLSCFLYISNIFTSVKGMNLSRNFFLNRP
jgi:DNA segregation ATPase FtsK/SpoIIIE-like protein